MPNLLGSLRQWTGSFGGGFLICAWVGGFGGAAALASASRGWQGVFVGRGGVAPPEGPEPEPVAARRDPAAVVGPLHPPQPATFPMGQ